MSMMMDLDSDSDPEISRPNAMLLHKLRRVKNMFMKNRMTHSAGPVSVEDKAGHSNVFDSENYAQPRLMLTSFDEMRRNHEMIDIVLVADNQEIPCHRIILAANSMYFKAMFTSNMGEQIKQRVTLKDTNPQMLKTIVDYFYTSKVHITQENAQELLVTANYFLSNYLVSVCSRFLIQQLDVNNCIEMHGFAESQACEDLPEVAKNFVLRNFTDVCKADAFLQASPGILACYIVDDSLNIESELSLLRALLEWLKARENLDAARQSFPSLVEHVRLPFIEQVHLRSIMSSPVIADSARCMELYQLAVDCQEDRVTSPPIKWTRPRRSTDYAEMLVVVGGVSKVNNPQKPGHVNKIVADIHCCDPEISVKWHELASLPYALHLNLMYDLVRFRNNVYATGGFNDGKRRDAITSVFCYHTQSDTWRQLSSLNIARYRHCSAVLGGKIHVIGGYDGIKNLNHVETYNLATDKWTDIQPMTVPVASATATAFNDRLYVIGGITEDDSVFNGIQCYNSCSDSWTVLCTMEITSQGCKSVLLNDLIYVLGGKSKEVQVYDPLRDKTFTVAPMLEAHMCTSAAVLNGKIYVAGGDNLHDDSPTSQWDSIEFYDPETDKWTYFGKLPVPLYLHGMVTVVKKCLKPESPTTEERHPRLPSMFYRGYGEGAFHWD